jgi:hypothetical protein
LSAVEALTVAAQKLIGKTLGRGWTNKPKQRSDKGGKGGFGKGGGKTKSARPPAKPGVMPDKLKSKTEAEIKELMAKCPCAICNGLGHVGLTSASKIQR